MNHCGGLAGGLKRQKSDAPRSYRVSQACIGCAKAKAKCDQQKPCTRCKGRRLVCRTVTTSIAPSGCDAGESSEQNNPASVIQLQAYDSPQSGSPTSTYNSQLAQVPTPAISDQAASSESAPPKSISTFDDPILTDSWRAIMQPIRSGGPPPATAFRTFSGPW